VFETERHHNDINFPLCGCPDDCLQNLWAKPLRACDDFLLTSVIASTLTSALDEETCAI
jgi:hypothetical protein